MGYIIIVILIGVAALSIAVFSIKSGGNESNSNVSGTLIKPRKGFKECKFPWFYIKNCTFYPNEAARFSFDENELLFLEQKFQESSKIPNYEQMKKICDDIIKINWKNNKIWLDAINATFMYIIHNGYEWDEESSRKIAGYCYGFVQTFNNSLEKSIGVKHILISALIKHSRELVEYQRRNFKEEYNLEVYNMLINIYYLLPFKGLLNFTSNYLFEDKFSDDISKNEYLSRSVKSLYGHIEMLKNRYKSNMDGMIKRDLNQSLEISECVVSTDTSFVNTMVGFSLTYPNGVNKAKIECRFYNESGAEIFFGENGQRYIEVFETANSKGVKEDYDIVILGSDEIKNIELRFYEDNKVNERKDGIENNEEIKDGKTEKKSEKNLQNENIEKKEVKIQNKKTSENKEENTNNEEKIENEELKNEELQSKGAEKRKEENCSLILPDFNDIKKIEMSEVYFVALKNDGTVYFIENEKGVFTIPEWKEIKEVYATNSSVYGVKNDGTLIVNGKSEYDNWEYQYTWDKLIKIAPSYNHLLALKEDGTVLAVGKNDKGQCDVGEWYEIKDISASFHSVALTKEGKVLAKGENNFGECNVSKWEDIFEIATGPFYTVGLKSDGSVLATGLNSCGQCNVFEWKDIAHIYARGNMTVGVKFNGQVVVTGNNSYRFSDISKWTDIKDIKIVNDRIIGIKDDGTVIYKGKLYRGKINEEWKGIKSIVANSNCVIGLKEDNSLICNDIIFGVYFWGDEVTDIQEEPVSGKMAVLLKDGTVKQPNKHLTDIEHFDTSRFNEIKSISVSNTNMVGLKENGRAMVTGKKLEELMEVELWSNLIKAQAGDGFIVGLKIDGRVLAAGNNEFGECDVKLWTDIIDIKVTGHKTIGLKADGRVIGTGYNENGIIDFVKVFSGIIEIAMNNKQILLLDTYGNVNISYHPDGIDRTVIEGWKNVKKIIAQGERFIALKGDGKILSTDDKAEEFKNWEDVNIISSHGIYVRGEKNKKEDLSEGTV